MRTRGITRSFLLIFPILVTEALGQPLSNEQVVTSTVKAAAIQEFGEFQHQRVEVITGGTPLENLIASALADALRGKSAEVMLASQPDSTSENLFFTVNDFAFKYKKGSYRGFLKHRRIKREFSCLLKLSLENGPDGSVIGARDLPINYMDQFDPGFVGYVNSADVPGLAPRSPGSKASKFVEPALVVASVSLLVYLFFANR